MMGNTARSPKLHNINAIHNISRHDFSQSEIDAIQEGLLVTANRKPRWVVHMYNGETGVESITREAFASTRADELPNKFIVRFGRIPYFYVEEL